MKGGEKKCRGWIFFWGGGKEGKKVISSFLPCQLAHWPLSQRHVTNGPCCRLAGRPLRQSLVGMEICIASFLFYSLCCVCESETGMRDREIGGRNEEEKKSFSLSSVFFLSPFSLRWPNLRGTREFAARASSQSAACFLHRKIDASSSLSFLFRFFRLPFSQSLFYHSEIDRGSKLLFGDSTGWNFPSSSAR